MTQSSNYVDRVRRLFIVLFAISWGTSVQSMEIQDLDVFFQPPEPRVQAIRLSRLKILDLFGLCSAPLRRLDTETFSLGEQGLSLRRGPLVPYPTRSFIRTTKVRRYRSVDLRLPAPADEPGLAEILGRVDEGGAPIALKKLRTARKLGLEQIPLKNFFPSFVSKDLGKKPECSGPNCFNSALRIQGIEDVEREVLPYEMVLELRKNFRGLKDHESPAFGDLLVFWSGQDAGTTMNIQHAAVYIDEDLILHKATRSAVDPLTFESLRDAVFYYKALDFPIRVSIHRRRAGRNIY